MTDELEAFLERCDKATRSLAFWVLGPNHDVIPATMQGWATFFHDFKRRQVAETFVGDVRVSTVFLGIDHGFGMTDEPLVFETMAFKENRSSYDDLYCERYATWDEAIAGHEAMVKKVRGN